MFGGGGEKEVMGGRGENEVGMGKVVVRGGGEKEVIEEWGLEKKWEMKEVGGWGRG